MTATQPSSGNTFGRAVGTFFKFLLRLIFVIVLGVLIGAALYFGVPWVYHTFVRPVQENTARVTALEQRLTQEQTRAQAELQSLEERVTTLEAALQEAREAAAARDEALTAQSEALSAADARLATLEKELLQAEAEVKAEADSLTELQAELEVLQGLVVENTAAVSQQVGEVEGRVALLQTAQDLLRVRLLLLEKDPRAAAEATTLAVAHLERARALAPDLDAAITPLQARLSDLRALIEEGSFRVGLELEALWAEVMELALPAPVLETAPAAAVPGAPTPAISPISTPTAPATGRATPTPATPPTPTPTAPAAGRATPTPATPPTPMLPAP